jgi:hypothetical protein
MSWRDEYNVHPAADIFPMMSDEELDALGKDIVANGLREPIKLMYAKAVLIAKNMHEHETVLLDGRNRLEAMERAGIDMESCAVKYQFVNKSRGPFDFDAVAYIISANIRRRHLTPQQQLDLIVAARMAVNKPGHDGPVSKGGRGKVNPVKAAVIADAKAAGLDASERTIKRGFAKARTPKPKAVEPASSTACGRMGDISEFAKASAKNARELAAVLRENESDLIIDDKLIEDCKAAYRAWGAITARLINKQASTLAQDGSNGDGRGDPIPNRKRSKSASSDELFAELEAVLKKKGGAA